MSDIANPARADAPSGRLLRSNAHLALILAAGLWGLGNVAQKTVLEHIGPMNATCLRCLIAAIAILPLVLIERHQRRSLQWWRSAALVALVFAVGVGAQQFAYVASAVTNASFLVNTDAVLTPVIAWLIFREKLGRPGLVGVVMTCTGIVLMSGGPGGLAMLSGGDVVCLFAALAYAVWMVALGRHAQRHGMPFSTAFVQFAIAAIVSAPGAALWEGTNADAVLSAAPELLILGIFSTAAAFGLQTYAQRHTSASTAAVLVSGESVFGAIGACVLLHERPGVAIVIGGMLIFAAIVLTSFAGTSGPATDKAIAPSLAA